MSKRINVNPDHYKTAGRERQGDQLVQERYKQQFGQARAGRGKTKTRPGSTPRRKKAEPARRSKRA
jgi:hypothetical protein